MENAKRYLGKLSNLLRSSVDQSDRHYVQTAEEVAFLRDYLDLQSIRFGEALRYEVDLSEWVRTRTALPVFSLQVLVENAIKHNRFSREAPLCIRLRSVGADRIVVTNNLQPQSRMNGRKGVGLRNLADRFRHLGTAAPVIREENGFFTVELSLLAL
ncbi:MAG: histidine kinase [Bacteroidota bacterium]